MCGRGRAPATAALNRPSHLHPALIPCHSRRAKLNRLLNGNLRLFRGGQERQLRSLARGPRKHVLHGWPALGLEDDLKRQLVTLASAAGSSDTTIEAVRLQLLQPPLAEKRAKLLEMHGDVGAGLGAGARLLGAPFVGAGLRCQPAGEAWRCGC